MSIVARTLYYVVCDECGVDDGDSRPTMEEAMERGEAWEELNGRHVCDNCTELEIE